MNVGVASGRHAPERHDREIGALEQRLERRVRDHHRLQPARELEVVGDRVAEGVGPVRTQGEPELERAERARVLESALHGMVVPLLLDHVRRVVTEGAHESRAITHHQHAAGLGHEHPLVRVDARGVGEIEPVEQSARDLGASGGKSIGTIHVHPHAELGAHFSDATEGVDRARQRRTRGSHDGHRGVSGRDVAGEDLAQGGHVHAPARVDRDGTQVVAADPDHLDGALDARVRVRRRVDRRTSARHPPQATVG